MAELCALCQPFGEYGYQDYPAPPPPVCAFKVHSGAQLKDFIQRGEVTELQIYFNRPAALEALTGIQLWAHICAHLNY